MQNSFKLFHRLKKFNKFSCAPSVLLTFFTGNAFANFSCSGKVSQLGIDAGGDVTVAIENSTPIHKICNVNTKGSFAFAESSCKTAYSALLSAKVSGQKITVFYSADLTCSTLPSWGPVFTTYFIEGPSP